MKYDELNHWYGWNGGECPVHPKTRLDVMVQNGGLVEGIRAKNVGWGPRSFNPVIAFKITREHREPREFWIVESCGSPRAAFASLETAVNYEKRYVGDIIHVREVLEDVEEQ